MSDKNDKDQPLTRRQKFRLVGLVLLKRVRFIAILAGVGLFIGYWDTVKNYWDKWIQPGSGFAGSCRGEEFYCPMDPQVVRSTYEPNGDVPKCPICGMPLSIRKKGQRPSCRRHHGPRATLARTNPTGRHQDCACRVPASGQATKTVGYVTYDEGRLSRIVSRVDGYVEKLYVDKTFTVVHKGDPLAEIYSPELYSTAAGVDAGHSGRGIDRSGCCRPEEAAAFGVVRKRSTPSWPRASSCRDC